MSPVNQEPIKDVLNHYSLNVLGLNNENYKEKKGVWWVKTSSGDKILKKVANSEQNLKFILSAVNYLTKNGILLPKINKTNEGSDYVIINNVCFTLTDAIKGNQPNYDSPKELAIIVKELAKFHRASSGFIAPEDSIPKVHLGTWVEEYTKELEDMNEFYKKEVITKNSLPIAKLIIKEFPYFYEQGQRVINLLKGEEYRSWVDNIRKISCLCHQDFVSGNLILNSTGLYVLDTDSITFDIPARDIRKLFNKIMKKLDKPNIQLAKNIFNAYNSINPLTYNQWQVVKLDLMFPHLFLGAMNKYYYQRDKSLTTESYMNKIKKMADTEKAMTLIHDNFNSIIQNINK